MITMGNYRHGARTLRLPQREAPHGRIYRYVRGVLCYFYVTAFVARGI